MKKWPHLVALFSLGFLVGLACMNLYQLHVLDDLYRTQNQLTNQLLDREIKLERLNKDVKERNAVMVKDLKILVKYDGNILIKDEIERSIQFYLSDLVGKELVSIDGEMLYMVLQQRITSVDQKKFQLSVEYIIISEKISISVKAKLLD